MEAKKQKMEGSPGEEVRLPESVEVTIQRILVEKQPPQPLGDYARKMLREIGEQPSLEILNKILSSRTPIKSFGGYVTYLARDKYPIQAAAIPSPYKSSPLRTSTPSSASPNVATSMI